MITFGLGSDFSQGLPSVLRGLSSIGGMSDFRVSDAAPSEYLAKPTIFALGELAALSVGVGGDDGGGGVSGLEEP